MYAIWSPIDRKWLSQLNENFIRVYFTRKEAEVDLALMKHLEGCVIKRVTIV